MRSERKKARPQATTLTLSSKFVDAPSSAISQNFQTESNQYISACNDCNHIKLEYEIPATFSATWERHRNSIGNDFYVGTSFENPQITVTCVSGIDFIDIAVLGVKMCHVICRESDCDKITRRELLTVKSKEHETLDCQKIVFQTPYSCCHVDLLFERNDEDFVCLLNVAAFSSSMPSSMSTPVYTRKDRQQGGGG